MTAFGRYEILAKLGEGAMGVVYRARDTSLGRVVALKMLSPDMGGEDEPTKRFQREAEAIGRLSHPNIVTVYDLGEHGGKLYMAMELLEGEDLRSLIERRADIPVASRVKVLVHICDGLAYAHSRGVVHRDIKPANILVTTAGKVKILDFGLARVATRSTITRQGVILGTPDYMSPEQAMGKTCTSRSDLFCAGAVFYEFLTGQKPFKGTTLHAVLYQILSEEPEPVLTLAPDLPARLAALVHTMLRKDPDRRYASMEEVGRELRDIHDALRRSRGRSARRFTAPPALSEEARGRLRDHLTRAHGHLDAGRFGPAAAEAVEALALDPDHEDAAEIAWRTLRGEDQAAGATHRPRRAEPAQEQRILALLAKAAPGKPDQDARNALAEMALIAPDDPRLLEVLRARAGRGVAPPEG